MHERQPGSRLHASQKWAAEWRNAVSNVLQQLAVSWHQGRPKGIYSVCSAHPWVLEAAIDQANEDGSDLLIEATSNQVNHQGGYTGMLPEDFRRRVTEIAASKGFSEVAVNPRRRSFGTESMAEGKCD